MYFYKYKDDLLSVVNWHEGHFAMGTVIIDCGSKTNPQGHVIAKFRFITLQLNPNGNLKK